MSQAGVKFSRKFMTSYIRYKVGSLQKFSILMVMHGMGLCSFSPDIFSGLICNLENPKATVVCFATGTLLFSGEIDLHILLQVLKICGVLDVCD